MKFKVETVGLMVGLVCPVFYAWAGEPEEVIVYGKRVPAGFYEYTLNLQMGQDEFRSLYLSNGDPYGSMSPLAYAMVQWNNRCGRILGNLMKSEATCENLVGENHESMLAACALAANSPGVNFTVNVGHPYLGGSVTWVAPTHQYAACADAANSRRDSLLRTCTNGFNLAKQAQTDCRGAGSW